MLRYALALFLLQMLMTTISSAEDRIWTLDSNRNIGLTIHGKVLAGKGVAGDCRLFDGATLISVDGSETLTEGPDGFSLTVWVNPYRLNAGQQMIAGKNRYSLGERQWSLMLDKDNRFRLYTHQGRWVTAESPVAPKLGHWYQLGVVIDDKKAELWVDGKLAEKIVIKEKLASTDAPVTFGGINDNGNLRQFFSGAVDQAAIYPRALTAVEMTGKYKPVAAVHEIPDFIRPYELWSGGVLPTTAEAEVLQNVEFHVIKKYEPARDGYSFLHGVGLAWHKGKLYASLGHNKGSENTLTEEGRYSVSEDGGKSWSPLQTIDEGLEADNLAVSHGVFHSDGKTLWAFLGAFYDTRKRVHTRAYTLDERTEKWVARGVVIRDGFWPMTLPVRMTNGNWVLPGFIVGRGNPAAVAISKGDDLMQWEVREIPIGPGIGTMWGESSVIVDGNRLVNIARYGAQPIALAATSQDFGKTWTASKVSNLPMAASKPCAGMLSNGQRYLICSTTADGGNRRSPLTIAVSRPGESTFSRLFVIRHALFEEGPGESHTGAALSYPYAIEYQGKLYVGYSNNGERRANLNSAELAIIPLDSLKNE